MADVHRDLLNNIQQIKEQTDPFTRQNKNSLASLQPLPKQLLSIADTLELIFEGSQSMALLKEQAALFSQFISQQQLPDKTQLTTLADDLLQIENQLKNIHIDSTQSMMKFANTPLLETAVKPHIQNQENMPDTSQKAILRKITTVSPLTKDEPLTVQKPRQIEKKKGIKISTVMQNNTQSSIVKPATQNVSAEDKIKIQANFFTPFTDNVKVSRDRLSRQNTAILQNLAEMNATMSQLQHLRDNLEITTPLLSRSEDNAQSESSNLTSSQLDPFSTIQQLSQGLTEGVSNIHEISQSIDNIVHDSDAILLQQSRLSAVLEQNLMNSKLLPFTRFIPRFEHQLNQVKDKLDKQAVLTVTGAELELDQTFLDQIVLPIEHLIRNVITYGIESREQRNKSDKNEVAQLHLSISREGASEILISLSDDGQGINIKNILQKAMAQNILNPDNIPSSDNELIQLILNSDFSAIDNMPQISDLGIGITAVNNEIKALKGRLSIHSEEGQGTVFSIRLPLILPIMKALMVKSNEQTFAIPFSAIHAATRATVTEIQALVIQGNQALYLYKGESYRFIALTNLLGHSLMLAENPKTQYPLLLFKYGDYQIALLVDEISGNQEVTLKTVGTQLNHINAINGATILSDGQVVFILNIPAMVNAKEVVFTTDNKANIETDTKTGTETEEVDIVKQQDSTPTAMIVDDSISIRETTAKLLKQLGFDVIAAEDGVHATAQLKKQIPDLILLDVEMPRMNGFEFATFVRNNEKYQRLPIIMFTSYPDDRHRNRALGIGVNAYLKKPFHQVELIKTIQNLLGTRYPNYKH